MPGSSTLIKLPHKKRKSSFKEFGGSFSGSLLNDIDDYNNYMFWHYSVPGTDMETGWAATRPSVDELLAWEDYVKTHEPDVFQNDPKYSARHILCYDEAAKYFDTYLDTYNKGT